MNDDLAKLEAERARLIEIAQSDERRMQLATNIMMFVAMGALGIVLALLISAALAGQMGLMGLILSALAAGILIFILSRKLRSGSREAMVAGVIFGIGAQATENPARVQIAKHDKRIASLKIGKDL